MKLRVLLGDARDVLGRMAADSVDACVADPPAGISFMGKEFDSDRGGRDQWIAWLAGIFSEVKRVLKPGGHALVWSLPRTSHWTGMALEEAGFEIRDRIAHLQGAGFPKSLDVSKAIDKAAGAEREIVGRYELPDVAEGRRRKGWECTNTTEPGVFGATGQVAITAAVTDAAKQWEGWGTALKPAVEDWWLVRKPLREANVAANVLRWGTGGLNVDGCRIGTSKRLPGRRKNSGIEQQADGWGTKKLTDEDWENAIKGRWPPNLLLSHVPPDANGEGGCRCVGTRRVQVHWGQPTERTTSPGGMFSEHRPKTNKPIGYADPDGTELVEAFECVAGCPVAELDRQSGERPGCSLSSLGKGNRDFSGVSSYKGSWVITTAYGDTGGASRFFPTFQPDQDDFVPWRYVAKADTVERNAGCEGLIRQQSSTRNSSGRRFNPICNNSGQRIQVCTCGQCEWTEDTNPRNANNHPTVKSLALCRWLITLITPPDGTVLDCFLGSGSVGCAAAQLGFNFIGIESDPEYHTIAVARIRHWAGLFGQVETEEATE